MDSSTHHLVPSNETENEKRHRRFVMKVDLGIRHLDSRKYVTADAVCDALENPGTKIELGSNAVKKSYVATLQHQARQISPRLTVISELAEWDRYRYDHGMTAYLTADPLPEPSVQVENRPLKELALEKLKSLEGTKFELPQRHFPYHNEYKHIRAHEFIELKVGEVLTEIYGEQSKREPNGGNSFPDYLVADDLFEVKTSKSRNKRYMVGTVSKIAEAFQAEDPKYLQAEYLVFYHDYEEGDTSFTLNEFHSGSIYNFSSARTGSGAKIEYPSSKVQLGPECWANNFLWSMDLYGHNVSRKNIKRTFKKVGLKVLPKSSL